MIPYSKDKFSQREEIFDVSGNKIPFKKGKDGEPVFDKQRNPVFKPREGQPTTLITESPLSVSYMDVKGSINGLNVKNKEIEVIIQRRTKMLSMEGVFFENGNSSTPTNFVNGGIMEPTIKPKDNYLRNFAKSQKEFIISSGKGVTFIVEGGILKCWVGDFVER